MSGFQALTKHLGSMTGATAAEIVGATADIALIIDANGVITDLHIVSGSVDRADLAHWVGKPWVATVTVESRPKIHDMLDGDGGAAIRQRQVNHILAGNGELPIIYHTVALDNTGSRVAVGKDLSHLAKLQQRLVNVQQSMDRDYSRMRQYEMRYRLLFQSAREAILIVDAATNRILEANGAACRLLDASDRKLINSGFLRWFDDTMRTPIEDAIGTVRTSRQATELDVARSDEGAPLSINLAPFKSDQGSLLLVHMHAVESLTPRESQPEKAARLMALVEQAPDALVVTDDKGLLLTGNSEFLDMVQLAAPEQAFDRPLSEWLGQGGIDYQIIMSSVHKHGSIRLYATQIRGEQGLSTEVEVSAVKVSGDTVSDDTIGFAIRNVSRRIAANDDSAAAAPRSIDQLTQLVGRVPLRELVRESTELIEQLCIQAALKLTGNNRASAAEMLGLSRQSLYVKLRRYSLEDGDEHEPPASSF